MKISVNRLILAFGISVGLLFGVAAYAGVVTPVPDDSGCSSHKSRKAITCVLSENNQTKTLQVMAIVADNCVNCGCTTTCALATREVNNYVAEPGGPTYTRCDVPVCKCPVAPTN